MTSTIEAAPRALRTARTVGHQLGLGTLTRTAGGASGGRHGRFRVGQSASPGHRDRPRGAVRLPPLGGAPAAVRAGGRRAAGGRRMERGRVQGARGGPGPGGRWRQGHRHRGRRVGVGRGRLPLPAGGRHERRRHRGVTHRGDLQEGRLHDDPPGIPRQPDLLRVHAQGQAARVHGPPLRQRRRDPVLGRGPHPQDGRLRRRLPLHLARADHARTSACTPSPTSRSPWRRTRA